MSIFPVSPTTGLSFLLTLNCGSSDLSKLGHEQNNLCVLSCWWISRPAFSFVFIFVEEGLGFYSLSQ